MINLNKIYTNIKFPALPFKGGKNTLYAGKMKENDMEDSFYKQVDDSIDIKDLNEKYSKKTAVLPLIMDRVMGSVGRYISGLTGAKEFSKNFLDGSSSLATRISIADDKNEYCENYKPELTMIKSISPLCSDYSNDLITKNEFDSGVETQAVVYVKDNTVRQKHFVK